MPAIRNEVAAASAGGKLYVFGKPVGPDLFQKDLASNAARANQNRTILPKH